MPRPAQSQIVSADRRRRLPGGSSRYDRAELRDGGAPRVGLLYGGPECDLRTRNVNQLWGDYYVLDPLNDFMTTQPLIHIEADSAFDASSTAANTTFYGRFPYP